jgi:cobalt transporter subunit CbtB
MSDTTATTASSAQVAQPAAVLAPAVLALLLGSFLVLATGFSHLDVLHNAAHDSRHSFAFPCH